MSGALTLLSNRKGQYVGLQRQDAATPLDAAVSEYATLPTGFGDILLRAVGVGIDTFSGAFVAPAPATEGVLFQITDSGGAATAEYLGAVRFVHASTSGTRPSLSATLELYDERLFRQGERMYCHAPVLAGAGVTGVVSIRVYGRRLKVD